MNVCSIGDGHRDIFIRHGAAYDRLVSSITREGGGCYVIF